MKTAKKTPNENRPALAFIGLGRMGRPMAARLIAAGYRLRVYDKAGRVRLPGAVTCASSAEAAEGATLEALGKRIFHAGPLGAGHAVKALNNTIAAAGTIAAFEAVFVGRTFGLDPALMTEIFNASAGKNSTTENKVKQHVLSKKFASGFALSLMAKDVGIAATLAQSLGIDAPLTRRTREVWRSAERRLSKGADHTEIYRYLAGLKRKS